MPSPEIQSKPPYQPENPDEFMQFAESQFAEPQTRWQQLRGHIRDAYMSVRDYGEAMGSRLDEQYRRFPEEARVIALAAGRGAVLAAVGDSPFTIARNVGLALAVPELRAKTVLMRGARGALAGARQAAQELDTPNARKYQQGLETAERVTRVAVPHVQKSMARRRAAKRAA